MDRSLSGNKNTLRPERSSLSDKSLMGFRWMHEHAHKCTGTENVNTSDKGVIDAGIPFKLH